MICGKGRRSVLPGVVLNVTKLLMFFLLLAYVADDRHGADTKNKIDANEY